MKTIITQLIDDFQERTLPDLSVRSGHFHEVSGKADIITGMRRTGKTFFCFQKIKDLQSSGISKKQILYLNFEDDRLLDFTVKDFQTILDIFYAKFPENRDNGSFFFFDEIQRINQWEVFIRRLLDTENVRIYLTGSSSKLLSKEISTSLRGRSITTEIFPFSFAEYLKYHGIFENPPGQFGSKTVSLLKNALNSYMEKGGFPEIQDSEKHVRSQILQGYIDSVLFKDVVERYGISNIIALKQLIKSIISSPCSKFSVNKFYNTLKSMSVKCTKNSLYEYLEHLKDAYLFFQTPLHSRSEKSRAVNPAKIYTVDSGIINAMRFRDSSDSGYLLENMVFMHLRRRNFEIEYVITGNGYETDFLVRNPENGKKQLLQVCFDISDKKTFEREMRGLKDAMTELKINNGMIISYEDEAEFGNIKVIPAWKWLLTSPD